MQQHTTSGRYSEYAIVFCMAPVCRYSSHPVPAAVFSIPIPVPQLSLPISFPQKLLPITFNNSWLYTFTWQTVNFFDVKYNYKLEVQIHFVSNKTINLTWDYNFSKRRLISSLFFHCQIPEKILYTNIINIVHLILSMFLQHYLVNLENYNCYWFHLYCIWHLRIHLAR